ncbi:uracil-xanthine permease family protein [Clostridium formicaceticum]|uniref:Uracil permease n=1 Tax=Clostridium formicaceticum TaxID=1497 RepID=A0AAC9RJR1_9CLOT|nr:nucleobase:cation symporter-2 family protein [Clostridium formicaceticum]AOY76484.1 uracil permease [Clostridium formicaceticum]ARE86889.1 Uric acid permease PucK [Clostridium formicaceticum]
MLNSKDNNPNLDAKYDVDGKPPLKEAIPLGLQHVLAMFAGNVTVPLIIAGALGLTMGERTFLIQCAMLVAGITTLIQANRIGPVGANLPIVMGTSFGFVPTSIAIGNQFGLSGILGAAFVGGFFEAILGFFLKPLRKYFPPIVTGTVLLTIGLSLLPTGINYFAGGVGAPDFGSLQNLALGSLVLVTIIFFNQYFKGILRMAAILIGIIVGYVAAIFMGKVDFASVAEAAWFSIPTPMAYGMTFHGSAIIAMLILYVVTTVETVGDISGITVGGAGREATDQELSGGVIADGLASSFAALFNAFPNTSFSQNVGIVSLTGIMSRYVVSVGAIFLILAGLVPKLGAILAVMPQSVLGGAAVVMFAMIATSGIVLVAKDDLSQRNLLIVAVALGLGLGLGSVPEALQHFPESVSLIFSGSGMVVSCIIALVLNIILPKEKQSAVQKAAAKNGRVITKSEATSA